jgi:DNA invertase Pin-like site-specific DNA recombinase
VGEVFADAGVTGSSAERPGLSRLFAAVRDGTVERVLVTTPDRLSRNQADAGAILRELEARGVACVFVD